MSEPTVRIVHTVNGSHPEPPLDEAADPADKLRWRVAVLRATTHYDGPIEVQEFPSNLTITFGSLSHAASFESAWWLLNGVELGLQLAASLVESEPA